MPDRFILFIPWLAIPHCHLIHVSNLWFWPIVVIRLLHYRMIELWAHTHGLSAQVVLLSQYGVLPARQTLHETFSRHSQIYWIICNPAGTLPRCATSQDFYDRASKACSIHTCHGRLDRAALSWLASRMAGVTHDNCPQLTELRIIARWHSWYIR